MDESEAKISFSRRSHSVRLFCGLRLRCEAIFGFFVHWHFFRAAGGLRVELADERMRDNPLKPSLCRISRMAAPFLLF